MTTKNNSKKQSLFMATVNGIISVTEFIGSHYEDKENTEKTDNMIVCQAIKTDGRLSIEIGLARRNYDKIEKAYLNTAKLVQVYSMRSDKTLKEVIAILLDRLEVADFKKDINQQYGTSLQVRFANGYYILRHSGSVNSDRLKVVTTTVNAVEFTELLNGLKEIKVIGSVADSINSFLMDSMVEAGIYQGRSADII